MVNAKDLNFSEPRNLPTQRILRNNFGIDYNESDLRFGDILSEEQNYPLVEFINDFYEMKFDVFQVKFESLLDCTLNNKGYVIGYDQVMPIRDLAYFAKKEIKFAEVLRVGRERGNWVKTIRLDVQITTSQTDLVMDFIKKTINNEKLQLSDIIMLKYLKRVDHNDYPLHKIFKSVDVREMQTLKYIIIGYAEGFKGQNVDYSEDIDRLEIDIIKTLQGGCNKRELKTNDSVKRIIHPKASNNNCFFKCIQPFIPELREKILKSECNRIRNKFRLKDNSEIDIQTALGIFNSYNYGENGLEIWSNDILLGEVKGNNLSLKLWLEDNHYSILQTKQVKVQQCCLQCGRRFKDKHTCNTNMIVYKIIKDGKDRCVINNLKRDDFNFDCPNEEIVIVHYDIETHTRFGPENRRIHTPYIVGFVDNINNKFQYFAGSNCIEKFIKHLFSYCKFKKVYLNAFNGAKFDHYEFVKKLHKMYDQKNLTLNKLV